ncbi:M28 family peptidase [Rhodopirellula sp. SWK7]|uniref:M28 family peptidase n=1 Tax=Rhodopirellula sp. SWK7 TaxID=595460 RepID=UPI000344ABDF|nr:M28 family peptidase [Rhodopirellula sp. SWK7]
MPVQTGFIRPPFCSLRIFNIDRVTGLLRRGCLRSPSRCGPPPSQRVGDECDTGSDDRHLRRPRIKQTAAQRCRLPRAFAAAGLAIWSLAIAGYLATPGVSAEPSELSVPSADVRANDDLRASMIEDLKYLTSEELKGRSSIDPTIFQAAEYLSERFHAMGLQTNVFGESALQTVEISVGPKVTSTEENYLQITASGRTVNTDKPKAAADETSPVDLRLQRDFTPLAVGASSGTAQGDLVWVGYGIRAPEHRYDDYEGVDVKGKVVMMLRKEPGVSDPTSPFDGIENSRHAYFDTKVSTAIDQGAAAVLIVNDPDSIERMVRDVRERRDTEQKRLTKIQERWHALPEDAVNSREKLSSQIARIEAMLGEIGGQIEVARRGLLNIGGAGLSPRGGVEKIVDPATGETTTRPPIPVLCVSRELAGRWMPKPIEQIEAEIDSNYQPRSFPLPDVNVRLGVEISPSKVPSPNVVAVLPGRGALAEETLVIGAHFDHVGMGEFGSLAPDTIAIHNGADDNASGTSALLRVAGELSQTLAGPQRPANHRRIVFIAFTGEERGLLGSKHYVQHPRYPLSSTVAMINMDMVGRLNDNELTVYGTGSAASFHGLLEQANQTTRFRIVEVPSGYGPSDHASFYEAGIPVLFFFTGLHADYHRPSDDFDKLNLDGMDRITDMISQVSERLATVPERPVYVKTEANVQIRRQLTVVMGVTLSQQPSEVVLSSILASGPAQEGGLLAGDRVVKVGKTPISTIEQFMDQLRLRSPGDQLPLIVRRGDEELQLKIKLRPR